MNVLIVNAGSSSLKYQLINTKTEEVAAKGICERIGTEGALIDHKLLTKDLKVKEKPLALYLFSHDKRHTARVTRELSFGGGCINDVVIHLATSEMGFGGVGESGMGAYHGKDGFAAFSHKKSIVDKKTWLDLPMRYQPYKSRFYEKLLRLFLR